MIQRVKTGVIADGAITTAKMNDDVENLFSFRNRVINGDMRIDQRNAGAAQTWNNSNNYSLDRYFVYSSNGGGVFTTQRIADGPTGTAFANSMRVTITTADSSLGTSDVYFIQQKIEGFNVADLEWGTANAKTVTASFWVKSSVTGSFPFTIIDAAGGSDYRSYGVLYTINAANTWEYKTVTIPGETAGSAWGKVNNVGMHLSWGLGAGTNYVVSPNTWTTNKEAYKVTGDTNLISTLNATWQLTGVQLELGSVATPFERRPYGIELALCQRYFETSYEPGFGIGTTNSPTSSVCWFAATTANYNNQRVEFSVTKRSSPSVTVYNTATGTANQIRRNDINGNVSGAASGISSTGFFGYVNNSSTSTNETLSFHYAASSEL